MRQDPESSVQPTLWDEATAVTWPQATSTRARSGSRPSRAAAEPSELWTIDEVAKYLGVPKQTVYCWRTSGYGPAGFRVGKHLRWRASTVIAWTLELERQR